MQGMTYDSLMKPGQIIATIKRLRTPASFFTNMLGLSPYTNTPIKSTDIDTFGYDVYAATRTMAGVTAPNQPPVQQGRKPIGQEFATLYRFHPSVSIMDHEVFQSRQLGSFGFNTVVDPMGIKYIAMQLSHLKTTIDNSIEWMVCKMLQGGFGIKADGDGFRLCELDDPDVLAENRYQIPSENTGDIDGILDDTSEGWHLANAPIIQHLMKLSVMSSRVSGFPIKNIVLNGNTAAPLFNNTKLSQTGGSSFTIFDSWTNRPVSGDAPLTSGQYTVRFRALPQYTFHIYNEGLVTNKIVPTESGQIDTANYEMLVPDDHAFFLPDSPSNWTSFAVGREIVQEEVHLQPKVVSGFHNWRTRDIDPARFEHKFLLKYVPLLLQPRAVFFGKVSTLSELDD